MHIPWHIVQIQWRRFPHCFRVVPEGKALHNNAPCTEAGGLWVELTQAKHDEPKITCNKRKITTNNADLFMCCRFSATAMTAEASAQLRQLIFKDSNFKFITWLVYVREL